MRDRRLLAAFAALGMLTLAVRHPTASLQIVTHDATDPSPHRMQAAVDIGLIGVSVLYTWTVRKLG